MMTPANGRWTCNSRRISENVVATDGDYIGFSWQGDGRRGSFVPDSSTTRSVTRQKPQRRFSESNVSLSPRDASGGDLCYTGEAPVTSEEVRQSTNVSSKNGSCSGSLRALTRRLEDVATSQQTSDWDSVSPAPDSEDWTTWERTPDNAESVMDAVEIDERYRHSIPSPHHAATSLEASIGVNSTFSIHNNATIKDKAKRRRRSCLEPSAKTTILADEIGKSGKPVRRNTGARTVDTFGESTKSQIGADAKEHVHSEGSDDLRPGRLAQLPMIDAQNISDLHEQAPSRQLRAKKSRSKDRRAEEDCHEANDGLLQNKIISYWKRPDQRFQPSTGQEINFGNDVCFHSASHREAKSSSLNALSTAMHITDNGLQSSRPSTANQSRPKKLIPKPEKRSSSMSAGNRQENRNQRSASVFSKEHSTARSTASRLSQPHSDSLQNAFRSDPGSKSLAEDTANVSQLMNTSGVATTLKSTEPNDYTDIAFKRSDKYSTKNIQKEETGSKQHQEKRDGKRESTVKSQLRDTQRADGTSSSLPPLKPRESRIPAITSYTRYSHSLIQTHDNASKSNAQTTTQLQRKTSTVRGRARSFWICAVSFLLLIFAGQYFIWNMEISGADDSLPTQTIRVLENVCPGRKPSFICGVEEEPIATTNEESCVALHSSFIETKLGSARCPSFLSKPAISTPSQDPVALDYWPLMLCAGVAVSLVALVSGLRTTTFRSNGGVSNHQTIVANRPYFASLIEALQPLQHVTSFFRLPQNVTNSTPVRINLNPLWRQTLSNATETTAGSPLLRRTIGTYDQLNYENESRQVHRFEERSVTSSSPDSAPNTPIVISTPTSRETSAATHRTVSP